MYNIIWKDKRKDKLEQYIQKIWIDQIYINLKNKHKQIKVVQIYLNILNTQIVKYQIKYKLKQNYLHDQK